jgi:hypothetical protein
MVLERAEIDHQAPSVLGHLDVGLRKKIRHRLHRVREQRCLAYQQQNDEHSSDHKPAVLNRAVDVNVAGDGMVVQVNAIGILL